MARCVFAIFFVILSARLFGADIDLVYPRMEKGMPIVYPESLDSTFVLGNVKPAAGRLQINGTDIPVSARGAFLAWLPLRKTAGQTSWDLRLLDNGNEIAAVSTTYQIESKSNRTAAADSVLNVHFPRVVEVTVPNCHIRTAIRGTYYIFPETGCRLLATGFSDGFFQLDLGNNFPAAIEARFVRTTPDTALPTTLLGNGVCIATDTDSKCSFSMSEPSVWHSELSSDGKTLEIEIFHAAAAIQRIRYDVNDPLLRDIAWDQKPCGVELLLNSRRKIDRGYEVTWQNDSLRIRIRKSSLHESTSLRGKKIVLDAGHGGMSTGSIGPLGTKEKDVTLRWAGILKEELERRGAIVRLTRQGDADLDLYERIDFARQSQADFLLSLHCNALPDNENPIRRHGSGTYYYQSHSRNAAEILHKELLNASGLPDDGLYDANLAVIRPTSFPSVLIEGAYIIYPPEEELFQTDAFLRRLSKGLTRGLKEYFKASR